MKLKYYNSKKLLSLITVICLLIVVLLSSCSRAPKTPEKINLRSFHEGKALSGSFALKTNIADVDKSLYTHASINGSMYITYESGVYTCVINTLHVKIDSSDAAIDFDSANTYSDEKVIVRNTPYSSFLGVPFKVTVDSTGRIASLSGYEKVEDNIKKELTLYGQKTLDQASFAAKEYLDESTLKMLIAFYIGYIPEKGLSVKDNWLYSVNYNAPYMVNNELSCNFVGLKDGKFIISSVGTIKTAVGEKNYTGLEYALTGTSDSKIYISSEGNLVRNGSYVENLTGYCYYDFNGSNIKNAITMTRNITFSLECGDNLE